MLARGEDAVSDYDSSGRSRYDQANTTGNRQRARIFHPATRSLVPLQGDIASWLLTVDDEMLFIRGYTMPNQGVKSSDSPLRVLATQHQGAAVQFRMP